MASFTGIKVVTAGAGLVRNALAMAVLLAVALLAVPASAQKGTASTELVIDAVDRCVSIASDTLEDVEADLVDLGWTIEYSDFSGPFVWELSASKIFPDGTDVYLFALIELYPTGTVVYCTYDAQAVPGAVDLNVITTEYEVVGTIEQTDAGVFGAWEEIGDGGVYYVLADHNTADALFFLQMTFVVLPGDDTAGNAAK
jgi:hypothetical protein